MSRFGARFEARIGARRIAPKNDLEHDSARFGAQLGAGRMTKKTQFGEQWILAKKLQVHGAPSR